MFLHRNMLETAIKSGRVSGKGDDSMRTKKSRAFIASVGFALIIGMFLNAQQKTREKPETAQDMNSKDIAVLTQWIRSNAIPLDSVEAGRGFRDLQPLKKLFKDVRIVGLGEATHGSREFFQFKHRMLEFLVKELGFQIFAIEASYAGCNNINNYVLYGKGDPAEALASQKFWTWDTEEVRDMIQWMREYNTEVPGDKKVKFLGYDLQHLEQGMDLVEAFVTKHIPKYADTVSTAISHLRIDPFAITDLPKADPEDKARILSQLYEMMGILSFHETPLIRETSADAYAFVLHNARVITQFYAAYSKPMMGKDSFQSAAALRDLYMAENIEHILNTEGPDARVVVWAHNGHISNATWGMNFPAMGSHLKKTLGDAYYALGFAFNRGSFQARLMDPNSDQNGALIEFSVNSAPEGSVEWSLSKSGIGKFVLNFSSSPDNGIVQKWLASAHPMRFIGAAFSPKIGDKQYMAPIIPKDHFDGVVFFEMTSRARPNPTGKRGPYKKPEKKI